MDDPNTTPITTPTDQFGGDYVKATEAHRNIQSLQTTTAQQLNTANAELAALKAQPAPTPPTADPAPTNTASPTGGTDNFDFKDGMMRLEDGNINPLLLSTLAKINMPPEIANNLVGHMENSMAYNQHLNKVTINETVGSQENFDALVGWGRENMPPDAFTQVTQGLGNRDMMKYAVQDLMQQAEVGGFSYTTPAPVTNEPAQLPVNGGGGGTANTPLYEYSPETLAAVSDPRMKTDPTYRATVSRRLEAGKRLTK